MGAMVLELIAYRGLGVTVTTEPTELQETGLVAGLCLTERGGGMGRKIVESYSSVDYAVLRTERCLIDPTQTRQVYEYTRCPCCGAKLHLRDDQGAEALCVCGLEVSRWGVTIRCGIDSALLKRRTPPLGRLTLCYGEDVEGALTVEVE